MLRIYDSFVKCLVICLIMMMTPDKCFNESVTLPLRTNHFLSEDSLNYLHPHSGQSHHSENSVHPLILCHLQTAVLRTCTEQS